MKSENLLLENNLHCLHHIQFEKGEEDFLRFISSRFIFLS